MRDLFVASVVFGSLPFALKRPLWGILVLAWLGYMNPHRLCYGFMLTFPVVQVVAIATLLGMLMSKEVKRMVWSREIVTLLILVIWMGITTTQALFPELAVPEYMKIIKIQILTFMTLLLLTSKEKVNLFVWALVLSLGFYGLKGGIFTVAHGGIYRVEGPAGTFIGGNNELALALTMTIPMMRYLHVQTQHRLARVALLALMILTALAAIGSQSRGALLALSLTGTAFWLKGKNKISTGFLIAATASILAIIMPESWYHRMNTIGTYEQDESAMGRINAWWVAWRMAKDRFFGGGFESFQEATFARYAPDPEAVHDVHSIYFEMMGEHGFIGLLLFLALLGLTWFKCRALIRYAKGKSEHAWARDLAAMIQVTLVAYMVGGAFLGLAYFDYFYHLVALAVVADYVVRTHLSNKERGVLRPSVKRPGLELNPGPAGSG